MLLELAQAGDTIITLEVSRLSRSTQQLCELIDTIREKRLRLVIMGSITIDCREGKADPMSEAFLQMAGVFSQLELAMIHARVKSGMENGIIPWQKPWVANGKAISHATGKPYSLLNQMLLGRPGEYLTFKQLASRTSTGRSRN